MEIVALAIRHISCVQFSCLIVVREFSFVMIVAFPRDDVIGDHVRGFSSVWTELVLERVGHVLRVPGMIGIVTLLSVKVERTKGTGHEWTVDGNLMQVHTNPMVLCVTV